MLITFTQNELNDISYKISEIKRIASALESADDFSNETFNLTLIEIIKCLSMTLLFLNSSQKDEIYCDATKEQILIDIINAYNTMKSYEAEFII